MTYDNNDGPIYSMLSGKVLSSNPCGSCTASGFSCSGYTGYMTESAMLADCNGYAEYFGGTCLGILPADPEENYGASWIVYTCIPPGP